MPQCHPAKTPCPSPDHGAMASASGGRSGAAACSSASGAMPLNAGSLIWKMRSSTSSTARSGCTRGDTTVRE